MSKIQASKFVRKPFFVDAVLVTAENIRDVAEWCNGEVRIDDNSRAFIKVRVVRPLNERQTMAFVGDWVLYAGTGYKVYSSKAFVQVFEPAPENDDDYTPLTPEDLKSLVGDSCD